MNPERGWRSFPVGIEPDGSLPVVFTRREWDLGSEGYIGMTFSALAVELIRKSRFNSDKFDVPTWIDPYQGGIIHAVFKLFEPNPHELPGQVRLTASGGADFWAGVDVDPVGEITGYSPITDMGANRKGLAVGWGSRVMLNNLTIPGSFGGWAHFPMLDITQPPTDENVERLIREVRQRCGLEKFFVLRSSPYAMMVVAPELVEEAYLLTIWDGAEKMNHVEVNRVDYWFDSRWAVRCRENFRRELGLPNLMQVCGILRLTAMEPLKPEEPVVIAASF